MKILLALAIVFLSLSSNNFVTMLDQIQYSEDEYQIQDLVIETRDGKLLSGIMAKKKDDSTPRPVLLQMTIYVRDKSDDLASIKRSVEQGYIGVMLYTRGKRLSEAEIWPYEKDGDDAYDAIDWIYKQKWCDGRVGMFGSSYNGFTQWATAKKLHPALKTIVPSVANRPGLGLPTENGIYVMPNYSWSLYVSNNRYLDTLVGNDGQRFRDLQHSWWNAGVAFRSIDSIDGTPNRCFQRWLQHPTYDEYWQNMTPYEEDFAKIDIPVLTIDGYYNDSQSSSLSYLKDHYKYNPSAEHYLIVGPYDHFGAQYGGSKEINGYQVDSSSLINTTKVTFQWFDYIFKSGMKPSILKDKINYQVMGINEWRSAPSLDEMSNGELRLFFSTVEQEDLLLLNQDPPNTNKFHYQEVDFLDKDTWNNNYYPNPIIRDYLDEHNGFNFISEPMKANTLINGSFSGELKVQINKKDFDFGLTLYEVLPDGTYFHLSYIIGRASHSKDPTERNLLRPGITETIPFSNTRLVSKRVAQGNRLLIHLNVNKNPFSDLNYGTGKDVSLESDYDGKEVLKVKWYEDSFVNIPIWRNN